MKHIFNTVRVFFSSRLAQVLVRGLSLLLALLPVAALLAAFAYYAVDLPLWDEWWGFVPLLKKHFAGSLGFPDFWAQHNEHRLVFPKLLMLGLALVSGYDVRWEMAASLCFAALIYTLVGWHLWRNRRVLGMEKSWPWLCVLTAYAVFSLRQHENWFWGFQVQWYMNVCGVVLGGLVLSNRQLTPGTFAALLGCGLFALFSLSAGALYWVLVPFFWLVLHCRVARMPRIRTYLALWCLVFGLLLVGYFWGMQRGNYPGGLLRVLHEPGGYVRYVLLYLAGPVIEIGSTSFRSLALGAAGLAVFAFYGVVLLLRSGAARRRAGLLFLFLGCYGIGCALVTGVGRSGFGLDQASSSRYTTMSMLLWMADLFLLYASLAGNPFQRWKDWLRGGAAACLLCAWVMLIVYRGYASLPYIRYASNVYSQARFALQYHPDPRILRNACHNPELLLKEQRSFLRAYRLSVFRSGRE